MAIWRETEVEQNMFKRTLFWDKGSNSTMRMLYLQIQHFLTVASKMTQMMNRKKQQKTRLQIAPPEGMRWRVMSRYYHWRVNMRMLMQFQNQRSDRLNRSVPPLRLSCIAGLVQPLEPSAWEEIEQMPVAEAPLWKDAMQEELDALHQNKTWTKDQVASWEEGNWK
ncbi:uncharacterized protein LOC144328767 [Podarcis muralis]